MKSIKSILVGLMIGGAFGAKLGAYLSTTVVFTTNWSLIELGFISGAFCGAVLSLAVVLAKAGITQRHRSDHGVRQMAAEGI